MEVYIEYVIIDNMVIDCLLISLANRYTKTKSNKKRVFFAALTGTVVAVILPILEIGGAFKLSLKIALACIMVLIGGRHKSFKNYFVCLNTFVFMTFILGGSIYGIFFLINKDISLLDGTYSGFIPVGAVIMLAVFIYKALCRLFSFVYDKKLTYPFTRRCELVLNGEVLHINALIDSGNKIICRGSPVSVAGRKLVKKLMLSGVLTSSYVCDISVGTVGGSAQIKVYQFDNIKIYSGRKANIIYKPLVGITVNAAFASDEYDLILSAEYAVEEQ